MKKVNTSENMDKKEFEEGCKKVGGILNGDKCSIPIGHASITLDRNDMPLASSFDANYDYVLRYLARRISDDIYSKQLQDVIDELNEEIRDREIETEDELDDAIHDEVDRLLTNYSDVWGYGEFLNAEIGDETLENVYEALEEYIRDNIEEIDKEHEHIQ